MKTADYLTILESGDLEVQGLLPWSSNYTFMVRVCLNDHEVEAVYKPRRGERPLWDFAQGTLCQRERAAFVVSDALGWHLVPPTVLRQGPNGIGSVQLFVNHDPERHYFTFEGASEFRTILQKFVLLDLLINNADRKSGHVLLEEQNEETQAQRLWAIDHGICFHTEYKLRTVIWEFAGQPIPTELLKELITFQQILTTHSVLQNQLQILLSKAEINALKKRLQAVISQGTFRKPGPGRHYPWPPV
ncbi:MAG: SCO1664 family protein [Chloroflexi bacterium]|nr:MAG: SCO1664 family protein [Chloroflexota bacterium]